MKDRWQFVDVLIRENTWLIILSHLPLIKLRSMKSAHRPLIYLEEICIRTFALSNNEDKLLLSALECAERKIRRDIPE